MSTSPFAAAIAQCCAKGLTMSQTGRQLGCSYNTVVNWRNRLGLTFSTKPGKVTRGAERPRAERAVVEVMGQKVSLAQTPFDTTPDARVETAPRRRDLIGGSVTREELVLDGPADRVIGELRGAVVRGRVV